MGVAVGGLIITIHYLGWVPIARRRFWVFSPTKISGL